MGAEIEVRNAITIVGRGSVLIGYVRAGKPRAGQVTGPLPLGNARERSLEVGAVQRLSSTEGGNAVGLVFRNPPPLSELQKALPAGAVLLLLDQEG